MSRKAPLTAQTKALRALAGKNLTGRERAVLRREWPQAKLEALIAQLGQREDFENIRSLIKIQAQLYGDAKRKTLPAPYVVKGRAIDSIVSGGLPSLGKKR